MIKCSNYIAVYENGDTKLKGDFEIDKELHKDPGMRIVPIALKEYFVNGVPIEKTIFEHKDILDFCLELKLKGDWHTIYKYYDNGIKERKLGKITRYFISGNRGTLLKKHNSDGRVTHQHKSYGVELFNNFYKSDNYNINYHYYTKETRKIIMSIEDTQLNLF